jgi:DNA-binding GntR family transcriptional regulator
MDLKKPASRRQVAYESVRDWLIEGRYELGDTVQEAALARELGMSRTPVRSALEALVDDGLLRVSSSGAFIIEQVTVSTIRDGFEMRAALEGHAVRHADPKVVRPHLLGLMPLLDYFATTENDLGEPERALAVQVDIAVHTGIVRALQSEFIAATHARVMEVRMGRLHGLAWSDRTRTVEGALGHSGIIKAWLGGTKVEAEGLLLEHLEAGKRYVLSGTPNGSTGPSPTVLREVRRQLDAWLLSGPTGAADVRSLLANARSFWEQG